MKKVPPRQPMTGETCRKYIMTMRAPHTEAPVRYQLDG